MHAWRGRVTALVIVDVLSFSTCVDIATARGAQIVPFPLGDHAAAARRARETAALVATHRTGPGPYSLSPASLTAIPAGTRLVLPSPNGSRLSLEGGETAVFAGSLRNRRAVAAAARALGGDVAVIAAGERWTHDDSLRPAIEDWIGAGAILDALDLPLDAEARAARDAFRAAEPSLAQTIRDSISGRELIDRGFPQDVELAVQLDVSAAAPRLHGECYRG